MSRIAALTSLPRTDRSAHYRQCVASWRAAGMEVFAFNHPSEIATLRSQFDVNFIPVVQTADSTLGRPYIPISRMLEWGSAWGGPVFLVNADIELRMSPWDLQRIRRISGRGLCYFIRHNYATDPRYTSRELFGIDGFLLDGSEAPRFAESFLSMGAPFWDYWIPYDFARREARVHAIEAPFLLHRDHPRQWSPENWHRCALEFDRMFGLLGADRSYEACMVMAANVRTFFDSRKHMIAGSPGPIRGWVEEKFANRGRKTFLELGAHDGGDTVWMAKLPDVTVHAFEPDPRIRPPPMPNVTFTRSAVSDIDGRRPFLLSETGWGRPWTCSSSLKQPKSHLTRFPVTFGATIQVESVTLDRYASCNDIGPVDFVWADVQGAEGEMIRGGRELLRRTRYLYTAYSDDESYAGQSSLDEICAMLPGFRVVELWPEQVLLENEEKSGDR